MTSLKEIEELNAVVRNSVLDAVLKLLDLSYNLSQAKQKVRDLKAAWNADDAA